MFTIDTFSNPLQARVGFVAITKIGVKEIELHLGLPAQPVQKI
jgi:hypothetical protein